MPNMSVEDLEKIHRYLGYLGKEYRWRADYNASREEVALLREKIAFALDKPGQSMV